MHRKNGVSLLREQKKIHREIKESKVRPRREKIRRDKNRKTQNVMENSKVGGIGQQNETEMGQEENEKRNEISVRNRVKKQQGRQGDGRAILQSARPTGEIIWQGACVGHV